MLNYGNRRNEFVNNYIFVSQVVFILILGILIIRASGLSYENLLLKGKGNQILFFILLLATIPALKYINNRSFKEGLIFDVFFLALYIFITGYLLVTEKDFIFKMVLLMPVVVTALKYGLKLSYLVSLISTGTLFIVNQFNNNPNFDADIMLSCVLFLLAWLLGNLTESEEKIRKELERLATYDGLTNLLNHRSFHNILDESLSKAQAAESPLSLLLLDLDYFKIYNDSLGHQKGDQVLKIIADILREKTGSRGYCARYGGEEFVIILPQTVISEAMKLAEQIRNEIEKTDFPGMEVLPGGKLTVSIGIAQFPEMADNKEKLIQKADEALYKAKFVSRNKVEVYHSVFDELSLVLRDEEQELLNSIRTLAMVINAKDRYTYGHSERTMELSKKLSGILELDELTTKNIIYGSLLHDIGKIEISREVLNKPKKLNQAEWEMFKQHPQWGADIIRPIKSLRGSLDIILYHHENYDGTGYPQGLKGEDIPIGARILRIVDSYDAITTNRPYKEAMSKEQALEELAKYSGSYYDPQILRHFSEMLSKQDI